PALAGAAGRSLGSRPGRAKRPPQGSRGPSPLFRFPAAPSVPGPAQRRTGLSGRPARAAQPPAAPPAPAAAAPTSRCVPPPPPAAPGSARPPGTAPGRWPDPRHCRSAAPAPCSNTSGRSSPGRAARRWFAPPAGAGPARPTVPPAPGLAPAPAPPPQRLGHGRGHKRRPAGEHLVEDRPQGVNARRRADLARPAPRLLRGHVRGRTHDHARLGLALLIELLRQAEVGDLELTVLGEQDVGRC